MTVLAGNPVKMTMTKRNKNRNKKEEISISLSADYGSIRAFANWEGSEGSGPWLYLGGVFKMFLMAL